MPVADRPACRQWVEPAARPWTCIGRATWAQLEPPDLPPSALAVRFDLRITSAFGVRGRDTDCWRHKQERSSSHLGFPQPHSIDCGLHADLGLARPTREDSMDGARRVASAELEAMGPSPDRYAGVCRWYGVANHPPVRRQRRSRYQRLVMRLLRTNEDTGTLAGTTGTGIGGGLLARKDQGSGHARISHPSPGEGGGERVEPVHEDKRAQRVDGKQRANTRVRKLSSRAAPPIGSTSAANQPESPSRHARGAEDEAGTPDLNALLATWPQRWATVRSVVPRSTRPAPAATRPAAPGTRPPRPDSPIGFVQRLGDGQGSAGADSVRRALREGECSPGDKRRGTASATILARALFPGLAVAPGQ
jgi:hypothetical protein